MQTLENYIQNYSINDILALEAEDEQFLALKNARENISKNYSDSNFVRNVFLIMVLKNSLISYQIAGSGALRRGEFAQNLEGDFQRVIELWRENICELAERRRSLMINSKYNKRIYNLKAQRLRKLENRFETLDLESEVGLQRYENMLELHKTLANNMKQKLTDKTVCFAVKMFGYAGRIVFEKTILYPKEIAIPLDSRLTIIYNKFFQPADQQTMLDYFQNLSDGFSIPALHLDSVLWLKVFRVIK